jgi:hypothetical protein
MKLYTTNYWVCKQVNPFGIIITKGTHHCNRIEYIERNILLSFQDEFILSNEEQKFLQ